MFYEPPHFYHKSNRFNFMLMLKWGLKALFLRKFLQFVQYELHPALSSHAKLHSFSETLLSTAHRNPESRIM